MIIELKKVEEINGEVWYRIYVEGICEQSFQDENSAKVKFHEMTQRAEDGYPKIELLAFHNSEAIYEA